MGFWISVTEANIDYCYYTQSRVAIRPTVSRVLKFLQHKNVQGWEIATKYSEKIILCTARRLLNVNKVSLKARNECIQFNVKGQCSVPPLSGGNLSIPQLHVWSLAPKQVGCTCAHSCNLAISLSRCCPALFMLLPIWDGRDVDALGLLPIWDVVDVAVEMGGRPNLEQSKFHSFKVKPYQHFVSICQVVRRMCLALPGCSLAEQVHLLAHICKLDRDLL